MLRSKREDAVWSCKDTKHRSSATISQQLNYQHSSKGIHSRERVAGAEQTVEPSRKASIDWASF